MVPDSHLRGALQGLWAHVGREQMLVAGSIARFGG